MRALSGAPQIICLPLLALLLASCTPETTPTAPTPAPPTNDPQCPGRVPSDPPWVCRKGPEKTIAPTPTTDNVDLPSPAAITSPTPRQLASSTEDEAVSNTEQKVLDFWEEDHPPGDSEPPYSPVWHAVWNAIAMYPDQAEAEGWWWKLPYYMALAGEGDLAANIYASQIEDALNGEGASPGGLPEWFQSGESTTHYITPHFELYIEEVSVPGSESAYLVNLGGLRDIDTPGSSCILVLQRDGKFTSTVLYNGFPPFGFFIALRNPSRCSAMDVTGDDTKEVLVDHWYGGHVGATTIVVFGLSSGTPQVMPFGPARQDRLQVSNGSIDSSTVPGTGIHTTELLGACDGYATRHFQWNGAWFEQTEGAIHDLSSPYSDCSNWIMSFAAVLPPAQAYSAYEEAFAWYQPRSKGKLEMLEELRVLQGLSAAYAGDSALAISTFQDIAESPLVPQSVWIQAARGFLHIYTSPADLYRACSTLNIVAPYYAEYSAEPVQLYLCSHRMALERTVALAFSRSPLAQLRQALVQAGVEILSNGWFDFDGDKRDEWWFVLRHPPAQDAELWVSVQSTSGVRALFVSVVSGGADLSAPFRPQLPVEVLSESGSLATVEIVRHPRSGEPFLVLHDVPEPDPIGQALTEFKQLRNALIMGEDPVEIYARLKEFDQQWAACPFETMDEYGSISMVYDCASYFYSLGLAAELAGDEAGAIGQYQRLVNLYPDRPLAQLALLKLAP